MPDADERQPLLMGPASSTLADTEVYPLIHEIRRDIIASLDEPFSYERLLAESSIYTVVQPLTEKYRARNNHATIFCLLLNRVRFLRVAATSLSLSALSTSRANLCEIVAMRVYRTGSERTLELASVLLTPWDLYQGAPDAVKARLEEDDELESEVVGNALEMAIISKSKRFIKSASCQKVIDGVWSGRVVYQASSAHAIIKDNYKRKPISLYNPHLAPVLDHYRLKVPKIRATLEYLNFLLLFLLFVYALERAEPHRINLPEWLFLVYSSGFTLDKVAAMQEHGLQVYSANLWNGFDLAWCLIFVSYAGLRVYGLAPFLGGTLESAEMGLDILAVGACVVFPRLAFVTLSDNLMILALRSMIAEFALLMLIAAFCFCGFLYGLWTLSKVSRPDDGQIIFFGDIAWWMLDIWFGLDASGFNMATTFHPVLGPILMIVYACLSNTLILTVLVAILSKTFADVSQDAAQESMFRRAVATLEGVKSDAIFSYQAPFNLIAVLVMYPLSKVCSPRWFHKINVTMIRVSAFPILLAISVYERGVFHRSRYLDGLNTTIETIIGILPNALQNLPLVEGIMGNGGEIEMVFEIEEEVGGHHGWDNDDPDAEDSLDDSSSGPDGPWLFSDAPRVGDEPLSTGKSEEGGHERSPTINADTFTPPAPPAVSPTNTTTDAPPPHHHHPHVTFDAAQPPPARRVGFPSALASSSHSHLPALASSYSSPALPISPRKRRGSMATLDLHSAASRLEPSPLAKLYLRAPTSPRGGNANVPLNLPLLQQHQQQQHGVQQAPTPQPHAFARRALSMSVASDEGAHHRRAASQPQGVSLLRGEHERRATDHEAAQYGVAPHDDGAQHATDERVAVLERKLDAMTSLLTEIATSLRERQDGNGGGVGGERRESTASGSNSVFVMSDDETKR